MNLNSISLAIYNAGRALFNPQWLFRSGDTGSWYKFTVPSSITNADAYQSTAAIYPVIDDGRGVVNLFINSSGIGESSWLKVRTSVSQTNLANPLTGRSDGCKVMETADTGAHYIYAASGFYTYVSGQPYIIEAWVEAAERDEFEIILPGGGFGANKEVTFNLTDETTSTADTGITYGLDNLGSGLYRVWVAGTATATASANTVTLQLHDENGAFSYTGDITKGIYVYGLSLRNAATTGEYQYTGPYLNGPKQPIGLLLAVNRDNRGIVNHTLFSEAFDNPYFTKIRASISTTKYANPLDGLLTANKLIEDASASNNHIFYKNYGFAGQWCVSIYAKAAERTEIAIRVDCITKGQQAAYFNLSTGAVGASTAFLTSGIEDIGDGWYRCYAYLNDATDSFANVVICLASGGSFIYNGDGSSGAYFYGLQVEEGDTPSDYQANGLYLGGPGDHMGNATSANRMTYALLPYGGVNNLLAVDGVPSEDISDVSWTKTAVTAPAPNYFLETAVSAEHVIRRNFTGIPSNTTNTVVVRVKDLGGRNCRIRVLDTDNALNGFSIVVNPSNGSVVTAAAAFGSALYASATITEDPEEAGQYIIALSGNAGATCTKYTVDIMARDGTTAIYLGDITKGLYVTKIALNYGDEALSYQKVTSKYNVEQPGLPQIPYEYGDGSSDYHTLGKEYFGLKQDGLGVVNLATFTQGDRLANTFNGWVNSSAPVYGTVLGDNGLTPCNYYKVTASVLFNIYKNFICEESTEYTVSFKVRLGTLPASDYYFAVYDVTNATFIASDVAASATLSTSEWVRLEYTFTTPAGCTTFRSYLMRNATPVTGGTIAFDEFQLELGSSATTYQANSYTLGGSLGTAGLFCDPTQHWSVGGDFLKATSLKTIAAKAGVTVGSRTFHILLDASGYIQTIVRGSNEVHGSLGALSDLAPHCFLVTFDGSTALLYVDRNDPIELTIGTAVEEAQNITWFARTDSSPATYWDGYGAPLLMEARALTPSEARQFMQYHGNRIGVEA